LPGIGRDQNDDLVLVVDEIEDPEITQQTGPFSRPPVSPLF
jgi:hypothetical protein